MKNKKLKTFAILVATLCGFISNIRAGTFQCVAIVGNFTDRSSVRSPYTGPQGSAASADFANNTCQTPVES